MTRVSGPPQDARVRADRCPAPTGTSRTAFAVAESQSAVSTAPSMPTLPIEPVRSTRARPRAEAGDTPVPLARTVAIVEATLIPPTSSGSSCWTLARRSQEGRESSGRPVPWAVSRTQGAAPPDASNVAAPSRNVAATCVGRSVPPATRAPVTSTRAVPVRESRRGPVSETSRSASIPCTGGAPVDHSVGSRPRSRPRRT